MSLSACHRASVLLHRDGNVLPERKTITEAHEIIDLVSVGLAQAPSFSLPAAFETLT